MPFRPLYSLLVFVPVCVWLGLTGHSPTWVFAAACLAILPLAGLMGEATEHLTAHTGPTLGGLLNASFGNAAELIIGFMALRAGELAIVKASITGSILGNLLAVLGLAMLAGGWGRTELRFNRLATESWSGMLMLGVVALVMPAIFDIVTSHRFPGRIESISVDISYILLATYAASLVFSLKTHKALFAPEPQVSHGAQPPGHADGVWPIWRSVLWLVVAASLVGIVSEFLVEAVGHAGEALGLSKTVMGVIVIALIGNAAEHSTAVMVARRGHMDLAVGIAMGSSLQIALFVAPVLVLAGHAMGTPLGLEFSILEVTAVILTVKAVSLLVVDGRTNWFEGVQLLAVYAILAIAFYFV
jgi:Ca2+:H+ antiporter